MNTKTIKKLKLTILFLWLILLLLLSLKFYTSELSFIDLKNHIFWFISQHSYLSWLIYIFIYLIHSIIFFPPFLLGSGSALLFGPKLGLFLTLIASNLSAYFSYFLGKIFFSDFINYFFEKVPQLKNLQEKHKNNHLKGVLLMRLTYLPFDPIGFFCGAIKINFKSFALGNLLGTLPGTTVTIYLGGSFLQISNLIVVFICLILGIFLSKMVQK